MFPAQDKIKKLLLLLLHLLLLLPLLLLLFLLPLSSFASSSSASIRHSFLKKKCFAHNVLLLPTFSDAVLQTK